MGDRFDDIDVGGLGGFVSFVVAGIGRLGHPLRGGWSHSPPVGKGGDVDDRWFYTALYTFLVGMSRAIMVNYARYIRDINRDTFEIWEIHARLARADLLDWLLVQGALSIV